MSQTNPRGAITSYQYDGLGRLTKLMAPDPDDAGPLTTPITNYIYNARGLSSVVDPLGRGTLFNLDKAGRQVSVIDSAGETTDYTYNFYDQPLTIVQPDPDGPGPQTRSTTEYEYDRDGRLALSRDALGRETEFSYDFASNISSIKDPLGHITTFSYDGLNRQTKETKAVSTYGATPAAVDATRSYHYDVAGNLVRTLDRNGRLKQYIYDKLDRVVEEKWATSAVVSASVATLDQGELKNESQKVGWTANSATNLDGTFVLSYTTQSTVPLAWNASAVTIRSALEALPTIGAGNVDVSVEATSTFSRSLTITFKNARGGQNLTQVAINTSGLLANIGGITPIQQTLVQGSATSERQRLSLPNQGFNATTGVWYLGFASEISGPLSPSVLASTVQATLNAFAGIDNVTVTGSYPHFEVTFGGTQANLDVPEIRIDTTNLYPTNTTRTIASNYNAEDELVSVSDPSATIDFTRDNLGRATTIQNQIGNVATNTVLANYTFHQTFDAASNRTKLQAVYNHSLALVNDYYYDKLDRLTLIDQSNTFQAKRVTFAYNALGQRTQLERYESYGTTPALATTTYNYDTANRLSRIEHKQGATIFNAHDYLFDRMSRISSVTSVDGKVDYTYDPLSQLLAAADPQAPDHLNSQAFSYTYDQNGNRNSSGYTAPTDDRVQTAPGGETYEYDLEGNLTRVAVGGVTSRLLTWDNRNRLTGVQVFWSGGSASISYQYDAFNRLISRTQAGSSTHWGYDEGINPHLQSDAGSISHRYLWSDQVDELLADEQNPGGTGWNTAWGLADHQGTIKDILDFSPSTGASSVANHRRYDGFGKRISQSGTVDIVFGYTGKYFDQVTGLQNLWNRWYSPKLGRFVSQDPIGWAAGDLNFYRYVGNHPTGATDPSGLVGGFAGTVSPFEDGRGDSSEYDPNIGYIGLGDLVDNLGNVGGGLGDGLSLGMSWFIREKLLGIETVEYGSSGYYWGGWGAVAVDLVSTGGLSALAKAGGKGIVKTVVKEGGEALAKNSDTIAKTAASAPVSTAARYGGAEQRAALLNRVRETGGLNEAKGVVHAFREMKRLGYSLEDVSLHYRGNQGLDLIFSNGGRYAVTEAKAGASLSLLKTYKGGLRQGSLDYNISRLERYLDYGDGTHNGLVNKLLDEASMGRLESFGTFYGSRRVYELPMGWPSVPAVVR